MVNKQTSGLELVDTRQYIKNEKDCNIKSPI